MVKILNVNNLEKSYFSGSKKLSILKDISFSVEAKDTFTIVGPSGSGKTTILGLCAGLDKADSGTIELCGTDISSLSEDERAQLRNQKVGFIFQDFQLLPTLTALENVAVPGLCAYSQVSVGNGIFYCCGVYHLPEDAAPHENVFRRAFIPQKKLWSSWKK